MRRHTLERERSNKGIEWNLPKKCDMIGEEKRKHNMKGTEWNMLKKHDVTGATKTIAFRIIKIKK